MRRTGGLVACLAVAGHPLITRRVRNVNAMVPMSARPGGRPEPRAPGHGHGLRPRCESPSPRDAAGNITTGEVNFMSAYFPGRSPSTGLHTSRGGRRKNGPIVIGHRHQREHSSPFRRDRDARPHGLNANSAVLQRLLANPAVSSQSAHHGQPGGAIRVDLSLMEVVAGTVAMTPGRNQPQPEPPANAWARARSPSTDPQFRGGGHGRLGHFFGLLQFQGGPITITGLHIHRGAAGHQRPHRHRPGRDANPVISATGVGTINVVVRPYRSRSGNACRPRNLYVNLHTSVNPGGAIRGQLATLTTPLLLRQSSEYLLTTGGGDKTNHTWRGQLRAQFAGPDQRSGGQVRLTDFFTGRLRATIPADRLTGGRDAARPGAHITGLTSVGQTIVVAERRRSTATRSRRWTRPFGSQVARNRSPRASAPTSPRRASRAPLPRSRRRSRHVALLPRRRRAALLRVGGPDQLPGPARDSFRHCPGRLVGKDGTVVARAGHGSPRLPRPFSLGVGRDGRPGRQSPRPRGDELQHPGEQRRRHPLPLDPGVFVALSAPYSLRPDSDRNATNCVTER